MWEEKVEYEESTDTDEQKSIEDHCEESSYKYFVNFLEGHNYVFQKEISDYESYAVNYIYNSNKLFSNNLRIYW